MYVIIMLALKYWLAPGIVEVLTHLQIVLLGTRNNAMSRALIVSQGSAFLILAEAL